METYFTKNSVKAIAEQSGFQILGQEVLPGNDARFLPIPSCLNDRVRNLIAQDYPDGLYGHQADAIDASLKGDDICISTSTASGKSLVFMAIAVDLILRDNTSKVLVFYPARALIQDQIGKWEAILKPFNINFGYIDGGVPMERRLSILGTSNVVLMTPDVAHAWLMSNLGAREIRAFLGNIQILILDEAHIYEGVFGTNMAYFLRRLQAVSKPKRIIISTATLDNPSEFVYQITGRQPRSFGPDLDCSGSPQKSILLAQDVTGNSFESMVSLLRRLARFKKGKFLAFGDTRRMVEQLVMALKRSPSQGDDEDENSEQISAIKEPNIEDEIGDTARSAKVLPYRAGYETVDRNEIQKALAKGKLAGVVSTSALELGIDIGEIDLIILLNQPPSIKTFWQRIGRGGRKRSGICLFIDNRGTVADNPVGFRKYIDNPIEPSWLYLKNRYIQYTNALCAAFEYQEFGEEQYDTRTFDSLPLKFNKFLENEINPTAIIPHDLYPLKQRAQAGPHREFPVRTGMEKSFQVKDKYGSPLGTLTFSQALREAYPGAIYYYMGRPYRVTRFKYRQGEIYVYREKYWTTRPKAWTMVFPSFEGGILKLFRSDDGFIAESEMQVRERVTGFIEQRGSTKEEHEYGPSSKFYQRELNRFFETTGVCWWFPVGHVNSETMALRILEAFCFKFGVQRRDLGIGTFHSNVSPIGLEKCKGICIFDATHGSLRLTERLVESFADVLEEAVSFADAQRDSLAVHELEELACFAGDLRAEGIDDTRETEIEDEKNCATIIAPGEKAIHESKQGEFEVVVLEHRYTPHGIMYELNPPAVKEKYDITSPLSKNVPLSQRIVLKPGMKWLVAANTVRPIPGETKMIRVNLVTGESKPL
ncbi:MAG: DEAD/DEAH box helicase [Deltaproteobacteria bacterium]|nr:DEAD/DEAH box helicase [Deltaproteobacteria bacterium]MBW1909079.1 DEAD/DEAH box helicase [Deltaproteobacteria bacterium]MBW2034516.1 DEAD/DEAH box helicase [Deltaproteobacteria bacterium]MBW2114826.1 DEAD/DEAH box helicase [Deltaproteobacteria bacterium]MBW2168938.1 DEAD/DEAH box helicase [Deltaproteobacteria bacterium]